MPSLAPFAAAGGNFTGLPAEMLRLNFSVPPSASPSPLGLLGGDPAGYPNGRRVGDDVIDITLKAGAGAVLQVLSPGACPPSFILTDAVNGNDVPYIDAFPYLGTPHQGYEHDHEHGGMPIAMIGIGSGLLAGGIALGAVFTIRRRRNSLGV